MKKVRNLLLVVSAAILLTSCYAQSTRPYLGILYKDVKGPVPITGNSGSSKVGTAEAQTILGLVTTGDASIETAAKSAGITKIHHIDYHDETILGIIGTYTIFVYGE